jgi:hypothetical protein
MTAPTTTSASLSYDATSSIWDIENPGSYISYDATGSIWNIENPGSSTTYSFVANPVWDIENPGSCNTYNQYLTAVYHQRVFSTGNSTWCYYASNGSIDPSPASSSTTPNWSGGFTSHQVLAII